MLRQSGLGLPDNDYYLIDEKGTVAARNAYRPYIAEILKLGGVADADTKADAIFKLETEIAKIHWSRAERRDAEKTYNPMAVSELEQFAPGFDRLLASARNCQPGDRRAARLIRKSRHSPPWQHFLPQRR
jgi:putative endopeptidase